MEPETKVPAPTVVTVEVPSFFDGCRDKDEVVVKMIQELAKPYAVERDGIDEMYRRLSLAMIVMLASRQGFLP